MSKNKKIIATIDGNEAAAYVLKQAGDPQMGAYGGFLYLKYLFQSADFYI